MSGITSEDQHILVPIDGSPQAEEAFEYALTLPGAEITVLTVINPFDIDSEKPGYQSPAGRAGMPGYSDEWYERVEDEIEELHDQAREQATEQGVAFSNEIIFGSPVRQIAKYAETHDIDHIIMGTNGRTSPTRIFLGSVAESVTKRSPVMVTVVR